MINFINHNHQTLLLTQGPNIKQTIHKMNKIQQQIHTHTHKRNKSMCYKNTIQVSPQLGLIMCSVDLYI